MVGNYNFSKAENDFEVSSIHSHERVITLWARFIINVRNGSLQTGHIFWLLPFLQSQHSNLYQHGQPERSISLLVLFFHTNSGITSQKNPRPLPSIHLWLIVHAVSLKITEIISMPSVSNEINHHKHPQKVSSNIRTCNRRFQWRIAQCTDRKSANKLDHAMYTLTQHFVLNRHTVIFPPFRLTEFHTQIYFFGVSI
jgi:hypothetical protein